MARVDDPVLIVGISTRALAESATLAGYACRSVDAFGDLDQKLRVPNLALGRDLGRRYSAASAVAVARDLPAGAACYVANLENHPAAVRRLGAGRRLLGNGPAALVRVRDPFALASAVRAAGGRVPLTLPPGEAPRAGGGREWLRKPLRGGGGSGVAAWSAGAAVRADEIVQERVDGVLASASFVADGRRAVVLGLAGQIAGDPAFGARGFRYCGSFFPLAVPGGAALLERVRTLADGIVAAFGLRGVNGIDFVVRDGEPHVLEVNPRPSASMELIERARELSIFDTHLRACTSELPSFDAEAPPGETFGKAILFARRDVVPGDTRRWMDRHDARDVPFPGDRIRRGHPICTLFARGRDAPACYAELVATALALETELYGEREGRGSG